MRKVRLAATSTGLRVKQLSAGAVLFLVIVLLTGCGAAAPIGFINETALHSDAQLMELWHQAQQDVSQAVYLNPIQHLFYGAPEDLLPGDSRALSFNPHMITVRVIPDLTPAQLLVFGVDRSEPTGMIVCPQPSDERTAVAFSSPAKRRTHVAASWEHSEPDWDYIVVWEFETQILYGLGYDISWR
jgi:hypothetical protein